MSRLLLLKDIHLLSYYKCNITNVMRSVFTDVNVRFPLLSIFLHSCFSLYPLGLITLYLSPFDIRLIPSPFPYTFLIILRF